MWVINNQKAQSQTYIKNDIHNLITQLSYEDNEVQNTIAMINQAIGNSLLQSDQKMTDACKSSLNILGEALRMLNTCNDCTSQLEVREWVGDDKH